MIASVLQLDKMFYAVQPQYERYGQFFVNRYISTPWPELFYKEDRVDAQAMITQWLVDNQHTDCLPRFSKNWKAHLARCEEIENDW